jgi:hypothetical protein
VLPGSTRQDCRSISAGWLLQGPQRLISALRFNDNGANLAASLSGLMRRGGFVEHTRADSRQIVFDHQVAAEGGRTVFLEYTWDMS